VEDMVAYKDLDSTNSLRADAYAPSFESSETYYPVMVLVHGGGFVRGCKHNVQKEAAVAAGQIRVDETTYVPQKFLVFNINYRLACRTSSTYLTLATETNGEIESNAALCGWHFTDPDTTGQDGFTYGPAVHDVEDAVAWIRDHPSHVNSWCPGSYDCWNGKIALVGNSSGGNLVYEAVGRIGPKSENENQVDAVGSWSGPLRISALDKLDADGNHIWPCASSEASKTKTCENGEHSYVNCGNNYPPQTSSCITNYVHASSYNYYQDTGLSMSFFANGTPYGLTGDGKREVISLASAHEFADQLDTNLWDTSGTTTTGDYRFCIVDYDLHARTYLYGYTCSDDPEDGKVYMNMVTFLLPALQ